MFIAQNYTASDGVYVLVITFPGHVDVPVICHTKEIAKELSTAYHVTGAYTVVCGALVAEDL